MAGRGAASILIETPNRRFYPIGRYTILSMSKVNLLAGTRVVDIAGVSENYHISLGATQYPRNNYTWRSGS